MKELLMKPWRTASMRWRAPHDGDYVVPVFIRITRQKGLVRDTTLTVQNS